MTTKRLQVSDRETGSAKKLANLVGLQSGVSNGCLHVQLWGLYPCDKGSTFCSHSKQLPTEESRLKDLRPEKELGWLEAHLPPPVTETGIYQPSKGGLVPALYSCGLTLGGKEEGFISCNRADQLAATFWSSVLWKRSHTWLQRKECCH